MSRLRALPAGSWVGAAFLRKHRGWRAGFSRSAPRRRRISVHAPSCSLADPWCAKGWRFFAASTFSGAFGGLLGRFAICQRYSRWLLRRAFGQPWRLWGAPGAPVASAMAARAASAQRHRLKDADVLVVYHCFHFASPSGVLNRVSAATWAASSRRSSANVYGALNRQLRRGGDQAGGPPVAQTARVCALQRCDASPLIGLLILTSWCVLSSRLAAHACRRCSAYGSAAVEELRIARRAAGYGQLEFNCSSVKLPAGARMAQARRRRLGAVVHLHLLNRACC